MTMMPPISRRRMVGDLLGCFEVIAEHRLFERRLADVLAGVDVDHHERLGAFDDQRSAARQPDFAVERLAELLVDVLPLEQGQPFDVFVVVLDAISERRGDRLDVALDLFVELLVVDDHAAEVLGELFRMIRTALRALGRAALGPWSTSSFSMSSH